MYRICFSILLALLLCQNGSSQEWKELILSSDNFYEIDSAAQAFFARVGNGKGSGAKQYTRWARRVGQRSYPTGEIINDKARLLRAYNREQQRLPQGQQRSTHGTWEDLGPFDYYSGGGGSALGRVNRITFHPTIASQFWVTTAAGGLWKTNDAGVTWTPLTDGMASLGGSGFCVDPNELSTQYLLTGDGDGVDTWSVGVMKSMDNGFTWATTGLSWAVNTTVGFNMVMHPDSSDVLMVAANNGLWRTNDGANTWNKVDSVGGTYWDIEFAPGNADTVYVSCQSGIRRSVDGGQTWAISPATGMPAISTFTRIELAVSPSSDSSVYALYGGGATNFPGLFKSTDRAQTFTMMSNSPNILSSTSDGSGNDDQAGYDLALTVDPDNDNIIYVGAINVWKSTDSGTTWQLKTDWRRIVPFIAWIHADIHELQFNGSTLYAVNDGGVYKSENGGDDWDELSAGLSITQFYYIDIHDDDYVGGTQDNGCNGANVTDPQTTNILDGDGFATIYHTGDHSIKYLSNQNNKVRRQFGSNVTITPSWLVPKNATFQFWDEDMDMHTQDPDFVFMGNWELFRGNGSGTEFNWDSCFTTFLCDSTGGCRITTITQGVDNANKMYVSNEQEILRSDNIDSATPTWTSLSLPPGATTAITDILVDPDDATRIWVSFSGYINNQKMYFSPDSGVTWTNMSGSLPNVPANCLIYHPGSSDGVYIGTDIGVYFRDSSMTDWIYFSNGLPNTIITDMAIEDGWLYAGTYGRGLWRTEPYEVCPVDLFLTTANDPSTQFTGTQVYHASNSVNSSRVLNGGAGTNVNYNAANFVSLTPGFWAKPGNLLRAKIEGCPN